MATLEFSFIFERTLCTCNWYAENCCICQREHDLKRQSLTNLNLCHSNEWTHCFPLTLSLNPRLTPGIKVAFPHLILVFLFMSTQHELFRSSNCSRKNFSILSNLKVDRGHFWLCTFSSADVQYYNLQASARKSQTWVQHDPFLVRTRTWPSRKRCKNSGAWRNNNCM